MSVSGGRPGKSTACNNELLKKAWDNPYSVLWYISPTYDAAKVMFRRATAALYKTPEIFIDNKSELMIELINGSRIFYKSGEVLHNLRTETLHGVVIDEVRNQHPDLWTLVLRPMLTTTKGWAAFISTPNGFDHFFDLYSYAQINEHRSWAAFTAPSTCNPLITEDEIEDARRTMSEAQFAQEYLAEFRDLTTGRAYLNFGEHNLSRTSPITTEGILHRQLPIIVAMDFNLSPMAWALGQKRVDDFYFFDEVWLKNSHTQEAAEVLCQKIKDYGHEKAGIIIAGDSTARAGQRAAAAQSDYDIVCKTLDRHGIRWTNVTPDSNPPVKDRVNNVNAKLKDASGATHLWIHPDNCPNLVRDFQRVVWKQSTSGIALDQTTNRDLTHISDAVGYSLNALSPLVYNASLPTLRVLMR